MKSWIGSLFGGSNVVEKLVDEAVNSKEEQARMLATERLKALHPFKIVQRIMIAAVMIVWVPAAWMMIAFAALGWDAALTRLIDVVSLGFIATPTALAFGLYFGGGTLESLSKRN
jgi:hypothetical protein